MPARRTKTKIGAKKATKKAKVVIPDFDGLPKPPSIPLPPEDILEPDSFQEYAPPASAVVKVQTKAGAISIAEADKIDTMGGHNNSDEELESVVEVKAKAHAAAPLKQIAPSLGSGAPVEAADAYAAQLPPNAAKTVTELINGLNYLYKVAKGVRGIRGLKEHDEPILRAAVKRGRELIKHLQG